MMINSPAADSISACYVGEEGSGLAVLVPVAGGFVLFCGFTQPSTTEDKNHRTCGLGAGGVTKVPIVTLLVTLGYGLSC